MNDEDLDLTPNKWHDVPLQTPVGTLTAKWIINPYGLQDPASGDKLLVRLTVSLPCMGKYLHNELQFGNRLKLLDGPLVRDWGACSSGRVKGITYVEGETWQMALTNAARKVVTELAALQSMLLCRVALMKSDGWVIVDSAKSFGEPEPQKPTPDLDIPF